MLSDIEIANEVVLPPIREVAATTLGIPEAHLVPYGHYKAKVDLTYLACLSDRPLGRLVLDSDRALPHAARGGQDHDHGGPDRHALHGRVGQRTVACLREPSMGPVFA